MRDTTPGESGFRKVLNMSINERHDSWRIRIQKSKKTEHNWDKRLPAVRIQKSYKKTDHK
jgi:hypothetical protein